MPTYEYVGHNDYYLDGGDVRLGPNDRVERSEEFGVSHDKFRKVSTEESENAAEGDSEEGEDDSPADEDEADESGSEEPENDEEGGNVEEIPDPPVDPTKLNVDPLKAELSAGDFSDAELKAIKEAEKVGEDRTTALDAIEDARGE